METTTTETTTETIPTTAQVIAAMLKENTGRHMLDSGGAYGRAWERNQTRDFESEEPSTLRVRGGKYPEIDVTHNVYHWLTERLAYSHEWQKEFDAYVAEQSDREPWLSLMAGFLDKLRDEGHEVGAPYDNDAEPSCVNTYNHECLLSQTLQFYYASVDGEPLVLLQVHGGCDVRGGYTAPKLFTEVGGSDYAMLDFARGYVTCSECDANWYSDDGSHWYFDGGSGPNGLEKFPVREEGEELDNGTIVEGPAVGVIFIDENKQVHCPMCAKGVLHASF